MKAKKPKTNGATVGFEEKLWLAADKMRNNMDPAEYKHTVLGLIFLKYISDAFEEKHEALKKEEHADPEERDEYLAENIFWVPKKARWDHIKDNAKQPTIGQIIDDAMVLIEKDNPTLKGVLPKNYARPDLDKTRLGELVDLFSSIKMGDKEGKSKDLLGRVYEYFLSRFASAEGKGGGEFYTPRSIVRVLVEMIEPYTGRVYDPCCGSGGMFVQSEKFVEEHSGRLGDISVYGQESNPTTWRLCKMNLAIRGIDGNIGPNNADSFHNDLHKNLKADFILANPPFNISDWGGERLREDVRWRFGPPPVGNANYAWIQHFIHHLSPDGIAGFVLANGSLSSNTSGEGEIRKNIVEADLVDCIIAMPGQLFYSTAIPVALWFICRDKSGKPSPGAARHPLPGGEGHYRGGFDFSGLLDITRELRKKATPAEELAWELLRDRRFLGLKFRRQHQIGNYIVDFYCDDKKLIVELDGAVHDAPERIPVDHKRDAYLNSLGMTVVRIPNNRLLNDTENALNDITRAVHPSPSGRGAGVRGTGFRDRRGETLFVDARKMGTLVDRVHRELSDEDVGRIAGAYHTWRAAPPLPLGEGRGEGVPIYRDIPGFCKAVTIDAIREHEYILTPGRYVGIEEKEEDGEPFEEKMQRLTEELSEQFAKSEHLEEKIKKNLKNIGFDV